MRVVRVTVRDFRAYGSAQAEVGGGLTVITGASVAPPDETGTSLSECPDASVSCVRRKDSAGPHTSILIVLK